MIDDHSSGGNSEIKASIIIPAYNEENVIKDCLQSVIKVNYPDSLYEVIVIDDGSTDRTYDIVETYSKNNTNIKLCSKENGGKASALNYGLKHAEGEYIIVTDADGIVEKNWISKIINRFENHDMVIGSCSAKSPDSWLEKIQHALYLIKFQHGGVKGTPSVGVNNAFRKSIIEEVGKFDETKTSITSDFIRRVKNAGFDVCFDPEIKVSTKVTNNLIGFLKQKLRWREGIPSSFKGLVYTHGLSFLLFGSIFVGVFLKNIRYFLIPFIIVFLLTFSIYLKPFISMIKDEKDISYSIYFILYELVEMGIRIILPPYWIYRLINPRKKPTFEAERD